MSKTQNPMPRDVDALSGDPVLDGFIEPASALLGAGLDMNKLRQTQEAEFEVEEPALNEEDQTKQSFDPDFNFSMPDFGANEDHEESSGLFESIAKRMVNLTEDGGVKKEILQQGVGGVVDPKSYVTVHYNGRFETSDEPFDSTTLRGEARKFVLGEEEVTLGFEIAVASMRKKEEARFLVQPRYFLGTAGCPPRIHANVPVLFWIQLVDFVEADGVVAYYRMNTQQRRDQPFSFILKVVAKEKNDAQSLFHQGRFDKAQKRYSAAIKSLEEAHLQNDADEDNQKKELIKLNQNLALCHIKNRQCGPAIRAANDALAISDKSLKALHHKAKALMMLCEFDRAKAVLAKAQKYHPNNRTVAQMLSQVNESMKRFQQVDRQFWKRAFGNKPSAEEAEKTLPRAKVEECSEQFKDAVKSCLEEFISNAELAEMPFPQQNFCEAEIAAIRTFAEDLKLGVEVRSKDCVRIVKMKDSGDGQEASISAEGVVE